MSFKPVWTLKLEQRVPFVVNGVLKLQKVLLMCKEGAEAPRFVQKEVAVKSQHCCPTCVHT